MSNDTIVTVQGWVGGAVSVRDAGGAQVANFRVGCTPRRFQRSTGQWVDGATQWYGVSAWRALGEHCARSLRVGDPVVVHGRLTQRSYRNKLDIEVTTLEIEAITVGHDLSRGVASFSKTVGSVRTVERAPERPAEPLGSAADGDLHDPWASAPVPPEEAEPDERVGAA